MKIDCSVTENFLKEWHRMCGAQIECNGCPLNNNKGIISNCMVHSSDNIKDIIEKVQTWSDKNQLEIDWTKVPMGTPVLIKYKNVDWEGRYFALYLPNANEKFCTFNNGDTREKAEGVSCWSECKLADDVDPTPYYK